MLALPALEPRVERLRMPLPVLRERLVQRVVERLVLVLSQLVQDEPARQDRLGRLLGQLDRHLVEAAHLAVAARLEEATRGGIGLGRRGDDLLRSLRARKRLAALEYLRPEAAALGGDEAADCAAPPCTPKVALAAIRPSSSQTQASLP